MFGIQCSSNKSGGGPPPPLLLLLHWSPRMSLTIKKAYLTLR